MEEQEKSLEDFRKEQDAIKKRQAIRHAEEKLLRDEQVKRLQVRVWYLATWLPRRGN